jgi:hypothetical protein
LHLGLDVNGIIIDQRRGMRRFIERKTGALFPDGLWFSRRTIAGRRFNRTQGGTILISTEMFAELVDELHTTRAFFTWMKPVQNAVRSLRRLIRDRHCIRVVTNIRSIPEEFLAEWLEWKLGISACKIESIFTRNKSCGGDLQYEKVDAYSTCDVVFDDELRNLSFIAACARHRPIPLLMASVGREEKIDAKSRIQVVHGWSEALRVIQQEARGEY